MKATCIRACFNEPTYIKEGTELDISLIPVDFKDHFAIGGATLTELEIDDKLMLGANGRSKKVLPQDKELVSLKADNKEKEALLNEKDQEIAKLKAQIMMSGEKPATEVAEEITQSIKEEAKKEPTGKDPDGMF